MIHDVFKQDAQEKSKKHGPNGYVSHAMSFSAKNILVHIIPNSHYYIVLTFSIKVSHFCILWKINFIFLIFTILEQFIIFYFYTR